MGADYQLPARWEFKWDGAASLAALLGCTAILVHGFVDFTLQIPTNAVSSQFLVSSFDG